MPTPAPHAIRASQAAGERERLVAEAADRDAAFRAAGERSERALAEARAAVDVAGAARKVADEAAAALRAASARSVDARASLAAARAERAEADARAAATEALAHEPVAEADLQHARSAAEALWEVARALAPAADRARERVSEVREGARAVEAELLSVDRGVEQAELTAAASAERAHAADVEAAVAAERAAEAGPAPEPGEELPAPEEAAVLLADLERRREALGAVNPLAAAEREELGEREVEMLAQMDDLEATAAALREHLGELDAAVTEGFEAIFSAFQDRFTEVCGQLFPGGEGRLRAVADEDGEAGIEVEVVPAGKRPRSLTLMSGGERSLVALAFCLALAMARPAPFYVLDEVEAALDDVNLRRFLTVVRGLAETQQFLLITHQQPTVEIADTLFGVTMGAEGVSQSHRAAAAPRRGGSRAAVRAPGAARDPGRPPRVSPEPEGNDPDRAAWAELFELAPPEEDEEQPRRRGLFARLKENLTAPRQTISPQLAGIFAPALVSAETWDDLEEALITADCGMDASLALVEELRARVRAGSHHQRGRPVARPLAGRGRADGARAGAHPAERRAHGHRHRGRQRQRQDHHHRQAGLPAGRARPEGGDRRRRHLPGRGHRPARGVGRPRRRPARAPGAGRRPRRRGLRRGGLRQGARGRRGAGGHRRPPPDRAQPDGGAAEGGRGGGQGRRRRRPTRCCWCSTPPRARTASARRACSARRADLTGVVLTKLDGTARGGIAVAIRRELDIPVKLVGSGEKLEDLQPFDARAFARAIFSTED